MFQSLYKRKILSNILNMEKKITLIIVDFQKDFSNVIGKLYVAGAENARQAIIAFIKKNAEFIGEVIFTVDWHTVNHCSFKANGGIWPAHCVQYSEGAGVDDEILHLCIELGINMKFFIKGNDDSVEEYGAFEKIGSLMTIGKDGYSIVTNNHKNDSYITFNSTDLVVCGIAGDYCVKNTIANLINYKSPNGVMFNVSVLLDGIASIDDGTTIKEYCKENSLPIVEAKEYEYLKG